MEKNYEDLRSETYKLVSDTQKAFENRLKEEKGNLEVIIDTKVAGVDDKCNKVEEELNKDVEILKEALDNNRELFTNKLNGLLT